MDQCFSCADLMFVLKVGIVVYISVCMSWLSVDIDVEFSMLSCGDSVKECLNGILDDRKTIIYEAFPCLGWYGSCLGGHFLNSFHAEICNNRANRAPHDAYMYFFVCLSLEDEAVV